jgi:hypothetical protein
MSPYKHGKPVYNLSRKPLVIIIATVLLIIVGLYYFLIARTSHNTLKNDNKPIVHTVKTSDNNTDVSEPIFSFSLPGPWELTAQNWDNRYTSWQWTSQDKKASVRWFEVYLDTIPGDMAVNYLLPVSAEGNNLQLGTVSDNCVNFTPGASPTSDRPTYTPLSKASLPSKWQQVNFLCDNANVSHQVVGTGSKEGINLVTLRGPLKGAHKFFLLYNDSNFTPDFSIFFTILGTFQVK